MGHAAARQPWYRHKAVRITGVVLKSIMKCLLTILLVGTITACIVGCVFAVYVVTKFDGSDVPDLSSIMQTQSSFIYIWDEDAGDYVQHQRLQGVNSIYVPLAEIPVDMQNAMVAIEDERFWDHYGVDWKRTISAFANLVLHFSSTEYGGSTITQQLIKITTDEDDHTIDRKINEIFKAVYLERHEYTKEQILEAYLNVLPLSGDIVGVGAAAKQYFGVEAKDLSVAQCALIAGITQNPAKYNPYRHPENIRTRQRVVLYKMYELGFITEDEYIQAYNEELVFKTQLQSSDVQDYYTDMVIDDVIADLMERYGYSKVWASQMVYYGGLNIYSCEDPKLQAKVEAIYADENHFPAMREGDVENPQTGFFVMDYTGKAVAVVGGRGEKTANRVLNRATSSVRQPGSTMKPIGAYTVAVKNNLIHFSSQMQDCYIYLRDGKKWPSNYNSRPKDNGMVLVDSALQRSLNTVSARLVEALSPQRVFDFLTGSLHMTSLVTSETINGKRYTDIDLSPMALGGLTHGVYVREMAAAYQIFGNGGKYTKPYSYIRVERGSEVLLEPVITSSQALDEDSAYVMNRLLQHVITGPNGTGRGLASSWRGWEVFGKTGTTQDDRDVYFVGGTPYYVAACWFGYDNNQVLSSKQTGYARTLWNLSMKALHEGLEPAAFTQKGNTVEAAYCAQTGMLATDACPKKITGVYKPDNIPDFCTTHGQTTPEDPTGTTTLPGETTTSSETTTTTAPVAPEENG